MVLKKYSTSEQLQCAKVNKIKKYTNGAIMEINQRFRTIVKVSG